MAVRKEKYFKDFIGKNYDLIDPFSIPEKNQNEERVKKNIIHKFSEYATKAHFNTTFYHGSDGSQNYTFQFKDEWNPKDKGKEEIRYKLVLEISKSGNERRIEYPCDLEKFLSKKGFKKTN